jgi:hypothetical protein
MAPQSFELFRKFHRRCRFFLDARERPIDVDVRKEAKVVIELYRLHPLLVVELDASQQVLDLSQREADIALRTVRPQGASDAVHHSFRAMIGASSNMPPHFEHASCS